MGRAVTEMLSRQSAKIQLETDNYYRVRVLNRFDMYVHKLDKSVTPCLVQDGFWESWITQWLLDNAGPATVFYDVGANTGYYSFLMYHLGAMVSAFEPNPVYFKMMEMTKRHLDITSKGFHMSPVAISDKHGTATLYVPKELHGSASLTDLEAKWETTPVEVQTQPLELRGCGHFIIKIDAEGHEEKIWDGMIDSLTKRTGPSDVLLEYTPGAYSDEFLSKLRAYDPDIKWINHEGKAEPVTDEWILSRNDWVMLLLSSRW